MNEEFTHDCRAIRVDWKLKANGMIEGLSDLSVPAWYAWLYPTKQRALQLMAKAAQAWITSLRDKL
ncbi:MAG TPA: hypothetical protein VMU78_09380 [Methylocella sp.]|nr:hypothetical protein [Methylocella sp.]